MNSKSLQYSETATSAIKVPALPRRTSLAALIGRVLEWFTSSELEQTGSRFRTRRERSSQTNILNSLPLEEKHRLGLYRLMD